MNRIFLSVVKKIGFVSAGLITIFFIYVLIDNRNNNDMTFRQKMLKTAYPFLIKMGAKKQFSSPDISNRPPVSFYSLSAKLSSGETFRFESLKGKKVLIVNTASDCGYTPQYEALQSLYDKYKNEIEILAFPSNDYKQQEQGDNNEIASFCRRNYQISFPLLQKTITKKNAAQDPVYQWLTDPEKNGWNSQAPSWNFSKYIINEEGVLTHYFDPAITPQDKNLIKAIIR
jgi:glutathione peroxidase